VLFPFPPKPRKSVIRLTSTLPHVPGLNVVRTANSYSNSSRDPIDRLAVPDYDPSLDLWDHMAFTTEEPFFSAERDTASRSRHKKTNSSISRDASKERKASSSPSPASESASADQAGLGLLNTDAAHNPLAGFSSLLDNPALLATAQQHTSGRFNPYIFSWPGAGSTNGSSSTHHPTTNFDSLLSGFPVDPFLVPPAAVAPFVQPFGPTPPSSLPPLTIRGSEDTSPRTPISSTNGGIFAIDPALALAPPFPVPASAGAAPPPAKRQKTSAAAATTTISTSPNTTTKKPTPTTEAPTTASPEDEDENENMPEYTLSQRTPLTAAEDKRRRNTAASARFRAKKRSARRRWSGKPRISRSVSSS
jgi:hypothetical protein